jgi:hypothetical protein
MTPLFPELRRPQPRPEPFLRVLRVLRTGRGTYRAAPRRLSVRQAHSALRTQPGVFLDGATYARARQWAQSLYPGARIVPDPPHGPGQRPHFHVETPDFRSGHIFYGPVPRGEFYG